MTETIQLPDPHEPAEVLAAVVSLRRLADRLEQTGVDEAVRQGWSWQRIADSLGVSRQAVHKKHKRRMLVPGQPKELR